MLPHAAHSCTSILPFLAASSEHRTTGLTRLRLARAYTANTQQRAQQVQQVQHGNASTCMSEMAPIARSRWAPRSIHTVSQLCVSAVEDVCSHSRQCGLGYALRAWGGKVGSFLDKRLSLSSHTLSLLTLCYCLVTIIWARAERGRRAVCSVSLGERHQTGSAALRRFPPP